MDRKWPSSSPISPFPVLSLTKSDNSTGSPTPEIRIKLSGSFLLYLDAGLIMCSVAVTVLVVFAEYPVILIK